MLDREKVIRGLECRLDINGSKYKHCLTCIYRHDIDHCQWACQTDGILEDALALLKEDAHAIQFQSDRLDELLKAQEPVEPKVDVDELRCGNCGHKLEHQELLGENVLFHEQYSYCPQCGKAVKGE